MSIIKANKRAITESLTMKMDGAVVELKSGKFSNRTARHSSGLTSGVFHFHVELANLLVYLSGTY